MRFLDLTLPTVSGNLALDEALLLQAESGEEGEVLRLWEWPRPAVVLGAACRIAEDVDETACLQDTVQIMRRSSGGGTVLLGSGCLLYTLVLSYDRNPALSEVRSSYDFILTQVGRSLGVSGVDLAGTSDLALANRKFSGNAQQRKRHFLLHHGTLLYAFDSTKVERYLRPPPRQPVYRAQRNHAEFLTNLNLSSAGLKRRLQDGWQATDSASFWPSELVRQLTSNKYDRTEWTRRR